MVRVLATSAINFGFKPKTIKLAFAAFSIKLATGTSKIKQRMEGLE
jgi:hypothetical protein